MRVAVTCYVHITAVLQSLACDFSPASDDPGQDTTVPSVLPWASWVASSCFEAVNCLKLTPSDGSRSGRHGWEFARMELPRCRTDGSILSQLRIHFTSRGGGIFRTRRLTPGSSSAFATASCFAGYKGGVITNCTKSAIVSFKVGKASQTPNVASVFD